MQISESERAAAVAAAEAELAPGGRNWIPPEASETPPTSPLDSQATTGSHLSGQANRIALTYLLPWGWIPSGSTSLEDAFQQGYRYINGQWVRLGGGPIVTPEGNASATTVAGGSTLGTTGSTLTSGGPRPSAAALIDPFVGGTLVAIRLTTGIGAPSGPLEPVRLGAARDLPRIVFGEEST